MNTSPTVRCPHCAPNIAKYGEHYHSVYDRTGPRSGERADIIAKCEHCGGEFNGSDWQYRCKYCAATVAPGELVGLFVPHSCKTCEQKASESNIALGKVCRRCREPYNRCCC